MNKKLGFLLYLIVLVADLVAVYLKHESLRYFTKSLLMPLLITSFVLNTASFFSPLKKWIALALFFSWLGDIMLMFEWVDGSFFILGLGAFLIAHIFYIVYYENIIRLERRKKNYWLLLPVLIYYVALIYVLSPSLGDMKLPVRIYGVVISYMLVQALQIGRIENRMAAMLMIIGSVLFVAADSILAINKFYHSFEYAGIAVMLTYGIAQMLIVLGAAGYISSGSKQ